MLTHRRLSSAPEVGNVPKQRPRVCPHTRRGYTYQKDKANTLVLEHRARREARCGPIPGAIQLGVSTVAYVDD